MKIAKSMLITNHSRLLNGFLGPSSNPGFPTILLKNLGNGKNLERLIAGM